MDILSPEIWHIIMFKLDLLDLYFLERTNRHFKYILTDKGFWLSKLRSVSPKMSKHNRDSDYKQRFINRTNIIYTIKELEKYKEHIYINFRHEMCLGYKELIFQTDKTILQNFDITIETSWFGDETLESVDIEIDRNLSYQIYSHFVKYRLESSPKLKLNFANSNPHKLGDVYLVDKYSKRSRLTPKQIQKILPEHRGKQIDFVLKTECVDFNDIHNTYKLIVMVLNIYS